MKSVLLGNGINIQFGGKAYSNNFIMQRIIFNAKANKYDPLFNRENFILTASIKSGLSGLKIKASPLFLSNL